MRRPHKQVTKFVPPASNTLTIQNCELKAYSSDLRRKVVEAYGRGEGSQREIAARFDVSPSFVRDLLKLFRDTGSIEPRPKPANGHKTSKIDQETLQLVLTLLTDQPSLSLSQLRDKLASEKNLHVSRATVWRAIARHRKENVNFSQSVPPENNGYNHTRLASDLTLNL